MVPVRTRPARRRFGRRIPPRTSAYVFLRDPLDTYPPIALGTPALDDFNTGPSQAVNTRPGWSATIIAGEPTLVTDSVPTEAVATATFSNYWGTLLQNGEWWAVIGSVAPTYLALYVRFSGPPYFGYYISHNASVVTIGKAVNGAFSTIATGANQALSTGDTVGISFVGASIASWFRLSGGSPTQTAGATDTDVTAAGSCVIESGVGRIDMVGGGPISHATPAPRVVHRVGAGR